MPEHKIWEIRIASRDDAGPIYNRPVRAAYLIESNYKNGLPSIHKRALELATEDGIIRPVVAGSEWINRPYQQERFDA